MTRRTVGFLIFFSIFLSLYTLINAYIFVRAWEIIPPPYHAIFAVFFLLIAYSFVIGRFLERVMLNWISTAFVFVGAYWLAAMAYLYLFLMGIDLVRLANHFLHILPASFSQPDFKFMIGATVFAVVVVIVLLGHVNARTIRVKNLTLSIPKNAGALKSITVAVASDIHMGTIICRQRAKAIVEKLNSLNADLVLLPGDVVDEDLAPVIKQNLGEVLRTIRSKFGVLAVTGNHEYIGGVEPAVKYLRDHGITVLRDEAVTIAESFVVAGREDRSIRQFTGAQRKPLAEILSGINGSQPVILMDHQPFDLHEAEGNGVDLQLSGHTHHGQLWPFNYITQKIFEVSWGYEKKGNTHVYVSSGVGTWGPPVKVGNHSEIINITITFDGTAQ